MRGNRPSDVECGGCRGGKPQQRQGEQHDRGAARRGAAKTDGVSRLCHIVRQARREGEACGEFQWGKAGIGIFNF